jgi:hypothetical protein
MIAIVQDNAHRAFRWGSKQVISNLDCSINPKFFIPNMSRLPLAAIIVLVTLLVAVMVVLGVGTFYTVYYS